jgi:hypothetical protein
VRSTAAPYTESRLTRSVANERVGFPVVTQITTENTFSSCHIQLCGRPADKVSLLNLIHLINIACFQ